MVPSARYFRHFFLADNIVIRDNAVFFFDTAIIHISHNENWAHCEYGQS